MEERIGDWMQTYTGKAFWALDPRVEEIDIIDIAHALSMICRFNGHIKTFYSVAQHSINTALTLEYIGCDKLTQLYGLIHDASEAYICDIPRPAKQSMPEYKKIEQNVQNKIYEKFNLEVPNETMHNYIKLADDSVLLAEGQLLLGDISSWNHKCKVIMPIVLNNQTQNEVKEEFLKMFYELI